MRGKLMDTLCARIKEKTVLTTERSLFATYVKIDFREAEPFGICLKKHMHPYNQFLAELKFDLMHEDKGLLLYVHPDKSPSISNLIKKTIDDYIIEESKLWHRCKALRTRGFNGFLTVHGALMLDH